MRSKVLVVGAIGLVVLGAAIVCWKLPRANKPADASQNAVRGDKQTETKRSGRDVSVEPLATRFNRGRKWAIVIGINKYLDPNIPALRYCVADARRLGETLVKKCGYEEERILLLTDDQTKDHLTPLRINLHNQIPNWLKNAEPGDTVLVSYSGHGFLDNDGEGYLAPKDCEKANLGLTGFRTSELRNLLAQCRATQKLLILDCCHAGGVKSGDPAGPSSQEIGLAFQKAEGLITLASCRKDEVSQEWDDKRQGLFTYFITQGLVGAADYDHNGIVDSDELYRYTVDKVSATAQRELNGRQTPVRLIGPDVVGVFALASVGLQPDHKHPPTRPPEAESRQSSPPPLAIAPFDQAEARQHQEAWAKHLCRPRETTNSIGMKLVLIPPGEFMMGSPENENERTVNEGPRHRVRITKPFYLGMYEVTQEEYERVMGDNPSIGNAQTGRRFPVNHVRWDEAVEFCRRLSKREAKTYRLPTEAEWEYACRAGTTTPFNFGSVSNGGHANCNGTKPYGTEKKGPNLFQSTTVGAYPPNAFRLYDMHGNVEEWCADWYRSDYYAKSPTNDPAGPASGDAFANHILRGGSWMSSGYTDRSAYRCYVPNDYRQGDAGLRVASTP